MLDQMQSREKVVPSLIHVVTRVLFGVTGLLHGQKKNEFKNQRWSCQVPWTLEQVDVVFSLWQALPTTYSLIPLSTRKGVTDCFRRPTRNEDKIPWNRLEQPSDELVLSPGCLSVLMILIDSLGSKSTKQVLACILFSLILFQWWNFFIRRVLVPFFIHGKMVNGAINWRAKQTSRTWNGRRRRWPRKRGAKFFKYTHFSSVGRNFFTEWNVPQAFLRLFFFFFSMCLYVEPTSIGGTGPSAISVRKKLGMGVGSKLWP